MTSIVIPRPQTYQRPAVLDWLMTVDHKKLGILYLYTSIFFFGVGGVLALLVRTQLAVADNTFVNHDQYNQIFTMHASAMLFLFIIPIWAGFGNYLVPLQIGALDMAFPRINAMSYWLFPTAGIVMFSGFLLPSGSAQAGWTAYSPLARTLGTGMDLWIIAVILGILGILGQYGVVAAAAPYAAWMLIIGWALLAVATMIEGL